MEIGKYWRKINQKAALENRDIIDRLRENTNKK